MPSPLDQPMLRDRRSAQEATTPHPLLEALDALWAVDDADELAQRTVDQAAGLLPGVVVALALAGEVEEDAARIVAGSEDWCAKELPLRGSIVGEALRGGETVEKATTASVDSSRLLSHGITTIRAVPLLIRNPAPTELAAPAALLFLTRKAAFDPAEQQLIGQFSRLAGAALERTRLLGHARQSAASVTRAFDVAVALAAARSHRDVIDALLQTTVEALDAERATLSSVGPEGITVQANYARFGAEPTWIGRSYPLSYLDNQPYVRLAFERKTPVIGGRMNISDAAPEFKDALTRTRHTLTVPLVHGSDVEALLVVSRTQDQPFADADLVTIRLIGSAAMLALRNARLYDETEQARRRSESLARALALGVESALDVASELNLADMVDRLVKRGAEVAGADRCVFLSVDGERGVVEGSFAVRGAPPVEVGASLGIPDQPLLVEAFRSGQATQGARVNLDPLPTAYRLDMEQVGWFATVPLIFRGRPIGALNLSRYSREPFTDEVLAALTQIGQITALAVRNARLFEDLEAASRSKTEFLNLAAHELRTPISVIKGYLSLILEGSLAELPREFEHPMHVVQEKAAELNLIVEDLLAAARVQAGTITSNRSELDIRTVVEAAVAKLRPSTQLGGGEVRLRLPGRPVLVSCDASQLERILDNLLNNAVAYSAGPPEIEVEVRSDRRQVRVEVADRGRGIPADAQERIFDQFVRIEDPSHGYTPGTGLGLYISRGLARQHGGDVQLVRSEPGIGSTFALVLPPAGA